MTNRRDDGGDTHGRPRPDRATTRVVVVDDHTLAPGVVAEFRDAVEIVGEAHDVASAVSVIEAQRPDVVLLDVHLPGGGEATS